MSRLPPYARRQAEWPNLLHTADLEVRRTLARLPAEVRQVVRRLPVTFERHPSPEMVADGLEPDLLGLFLGPAMHEEESLHPIPSQVILYLENIRDVSGNSRTRYLEEVRKTYLHEIGHYLGLDEDDLAARHLE